MRKLARELTLGLGLLAVCQGTLSLFPSDAHSGSRMCKSAFPSKRAACLKPWTFLIFMDASTDLAPFAYWDLHEMEGAFPGAGPDVGGSSTRRSDVVVQLDTPGNTGLRRIHVLEGNRPYDRELKLEDFGRWDDSRLESPVLETLPEHGNQSTRLREFISWGKRRFPSSNLMVIVWGHGQGWNGITGMSVPELASAIQGQGVDVFIADSCRMQTLEVVTELAPHSSYVIGSAQVQNFLGLPYRRWINEVNTGRFGGEKLRYPSLSRLKDEPFLVARLMPRLFQLAFRPYGSRGRNLPEAAETLTLSSISTRELQDHLLPSLKRLSEAIAPFIDEDPFRAVDLIANLKLAPTFAGQMQDLGAFLALLDRMIYEERANTGDERIGTRDALISALAEVHDGLNRTVISYAMGTEYNGQGQDPQLAYLGMRGLSLWVPTSASEFNLRREIFRQSLLWREIPGHESWIAKMLGE